MKERAGASNSQYSNSATLNAYTSLVMKHIGPFFAYDNERDRLVDEVTGGLVSSFTATKMAERDPRPVAAAIATPSVRMLEPVVARTGELVKSHGFRHCLRE
jgi:hypothetical protein